MTPCLLRTLCLALGLALVSACAPAADDPRTALVIVNAPAEQRVPGLAESLQRALEREEAAALYRFAFPASARFQETHRDMVGRRALRQADLIARNLGARFALMVGAPRYRREVATITSPLGDSRLVKSAVTLEVSLVAEGGAGILFQRRAGGAASRLEPARQPLSTEEDDPDLRRLREGALAELAPEVAALLTELLAASR